MESTSIDSLRTEDEAYYEGPCVITLNIGATLGPVILNVPSLDMAVDALCLLSIVKTATLDDSVTKLQTLRTVADLHTVALSTLLASYEDPKPHASMPKPDSVMLASVIATGGAIELSEDGNANIETAMGLAGLHYADGDTMTNSRAMSALSVDDMAIAHESYVTVNDEPSMQTTAASSSTMKPLPMSIASTQRPIHILRVRYETVQPVFDQWVRLRLSHLTASTHVLFSVFDIKMMDNPAPLFCGTIDVGARLSHVCSRFTKNLQQVRDRLLPSSKGDLATPSSARRQSAMDPAWDGCAAGVMKDPYYIFDLGPISNVGSNGVRLNDIFPLAIPLSPVVVERATCPVHVFDRGGKLLEADEAVAVKLARSTSMPAGARIGALPKGRPEGRSGSMSSKRDVGPPLLEVAFRIDFDLLPVEVRGALILRSVGVERHHPLATFPLSLLRQLSMSCAMDAPKFPDIASALPVLEPLFRHVSGGKDDRLTSAGSLKHGGLTAIRHGIADNARHRALPVEDDVGMSGGNDDSGKLQGLDERLFVGVCAYCTKLSDHALKVAFRQLDANGDGVLLWDEYVSYISRLLDNDLSRRAAQGTFLLLPQQEGASSQPVAEAALKRSDAKPPGLDSLIQQLNENEADASSDAQTSFPPELQFAMAPAKSVQAESEGIHTLLVLHELLGYAVSYRNQTCQILDDGLREALQISLHPDGMLASAAAAATSSGGTLPVDGGDSSISLLGIDWFGAQSCVLVVVCSDRRIRLYDLSRFVSHGAFSLKEIVRRRFMTETVRLKNKSRLTIQQGLLHESIKYRKIGLSRVAGKGDSKATEGGALAQLVNEDPNVFLMTAMLSSNPTGFEARLGDDTSPKAGSRQSRVEAGGDSTSGRVRSPAKTKHSPRPLPYGAETTRSRFRSKAGELEDIVDYGRARDYMSLKSSKTAGMGVALLGPDSDDDVPGNADGRRRLRQLTFASDRERAADPRLQALQAAARGEVRQYRHIGGEAHSITVLPPTAYFKCRELQDGMPTCLKLAMVRIYGRANVAWGVGHAGVNVVQARLASKRSSPDAGLQSAASAAQILFAIVGDNRGTLSFHRISGVATPCSMQTQIQSVSSIVILPPRADVDSGGENALQSSSIVNFVVGGLAGPITVMTVCMRLTRAKTDDGASPVPSFHAVVLRALDSQGAMAHPQGVLSMAFCATERCLITTGVDRRVLLWNVTDSSRADGHIGQLGGSATITSDRDSVVSIAANDVYNQIITVTKSGRIDVYDPRTLACIQKLPDDAPVFTRGIVVDSNHMSVITYGSHVRMWSVREAFMNNMTAAVAVAKAAAQGADFATTATEPNTSLGKPGRHDGVDAATTTMLGTPWSAVLNGYLLESRLIPKPSNNLVDKEFRQRSDSIASAIALNKLASKVKRRLSSKVEEIKAQQRKTAEVAARRTSAVTSEISQVNQLKMQLGGRQVRRGSVESRLITNMLDELARRGRSENEEDDGEEKEEVIDPITGNRIAHTGPSWINVPIDGRTLLAALHSRTFNQVVTVARDGLVRVYNVNSGAMSLSFVADHGNHDTTVGVGATQRFIPSPAASGATSVQVTAATLDARHRRLITGGVNGSVRVWNIANGMLLRNLIPIPGGVEVSCVAYQPAADISDPIMAGTTDGRLAWFKDQGMINDDMAGQRTSLVTAAQERLGTPAGGARPGLVGRQREEEKELLSLHVAAHAEHVSVRFDSARSPSAVLKRRLTRLSPRAKATTQAESASPTHQTILEYFNSDTANVPARASHRIKDAGYTAPSIPQELTPRRPGDASEPTSPPSASGASADTPSGHDSTDAARKSPALDFRRASMVFAFSAMDGKKAKAFANFRYLSPDAKRLVLQSRAAATSHPGPSDMGVSISRSSSPHAKQITSVKEGGAQPADTRKLSFTTPISLRRPEGGDHAKLEESQLARLRLAPYVVTLPWPNQDEFEEDVEGNTSITRILGIRRMSHARPSSAASNETSTRAEVNCVVAGGGLPLDGEAGSMNAPATPRLPPWVLTCSSNGMAVQWNPTTQHLVKWNQVFELDVASGGSFPMPASITCVCTVSIHGLVVLGTQTGQLHLFQLSTGKMIRSLPRGRPLEQEDAFLTGFMTMPASGEWDTIRRGAGPQINLVNPLRPQLPEKHIQRGAVCLACNTLGTRLLVGYDGGFTRIFDITRVGDDPTACFLYPVAEWRTHLSRYGISSADLLSTSNGLELFLTSGGFDAKVWSLDGVFVALFGQSSHWPEALGGSGAGLIGGANHGVNILGHLMAASGRQLSSSGTVLHEQQSSSALSLGWRQRGYLRQRDASAHLAHVQDQTVSIPAGGTTAGGIQPTQSTEGSNLQGPDSRSGLVAEPSDIMDSFDSRGSSLHLVAARRYSAAHSPRPASMDATHAKLPRSLHKKFTAGNKLITAIANAAAGMAISVPSPPSLARPLRNSQRPGNALTVVSYNNDIAEEDTRKVSTSAELLRTLDQDVYETLVEKDSLKESDGAWEDDLASTDPRVLYEAALSQAKEEVSRQAASTVLSASLPAFARNPYTYLGQGKWKSQRIMS